MADGVDMETNTTQNQPSHLAATVRVVLLYLAAVAPFFYLLTKLPN